MERFKPSRILIEASGVADPVSIRATVREKELQDKLVLKKIVTVLDADLWEGRAIFGPLFFHQLEIANLILLNKIDLLDTKMIPTILEEIHDLMPATQVVPTIRCNVDPGVFAANPAAFAVDLKPMHFFDRLSTDSAVSGKKPGNHEFLSVKAKDDLGRAIDASGFVTFSFQSVVPMDENRFKSFVADLPWELFRLKGSVRLVDRTVFVNFVGGKCEWFPTQGPAETRLAFIGWCIQADEVLSRLKTCLATH